MTHCVQKPICDSPLTLKCKSCLELVVINVLYVQLMAVLLFATDVNQTFLQNAQEGCYEIEISIGSTINTLRCY